ncbi:MAG: phage portal protein [Erysipelotrichaceae bacterium]|nr:phage portal protein [Erysipelotrichaceae bacterium]
MFNDDGTGQGYNWDKIPLIPFRCNEEEIPLITRCKSIQDGLNKIESQWQDQMEEDPRNTIMVLVNYDGQNLGEFRRNLAQYGAVKVRTVDGGGGDVKTLQIQVNAENYKAIIEQFKKAIIENCMGYDAKDDRLGGNANEMNIKSMYSDIELDSNGMETEFQAAFEDLIWFLNCYFANSHIGDFEGEEYEIIFNRDTMISESSVINDIKNSVGILSDETLIAQHPWIDDPEAEIERIKKQKEENMDLYGGAFGGKGDPDDEPDDE